MTSRTPETDLISDIPRRLTVLEKGKPELMIKGVIRKRIAV
jgi:hypothetical protein